ncbi:hypothetical protein SAMN05421866_2334 [Chryseobacterium oranimense]|uniref:Uncharacterized protein n=1 Tax=Chryseobacterium oranimense TaxID=421058 RepID=A0A1M5RCV3_9FLAO|nr:hypothetical protein SAMN05421866_2334 [Chryseobacterium oranimense]
MTVSLRHVQGFPLLGLLRRLRCRIGYSGAFSIATPVAFRLRQSPFRHIATIGTLDCRMRCSPFSAYCSYVVVCLCYHYYLSLGYYHKVTLVTVFRHCLRTDRSDCRSINQDFILISNFSTRHSVATRQLVDLWLFRHATLPVGFPVRISRLLMGVINTCPVVAKPHSLYALMGAPSILRGLLPLRTLPSVCRPILSKPLCTSDWHRCSY